MALTQRPVLTTVVVLALAACSTLGWYATMYTGSQNGLFKGLAHYVGGPAPFKRAYTGWATLDGTLRTLVAFFSAIIDGGIGWDVSLAYVWVMGQFCTSWTLLSVEAVRGGARAKAALAVLGICCQMVTAAISLPIYLILRILISPVSTILPMGAPSSGLSDLPSFDPADEDALPLTITLTYILPAMFMSLPSPSLVPSASHYGWIAVWQGFSIWQLILQPALKRLVTFSTSVLPSANSTTATNASSRPSTRLSPASSPVYPFVLTLAVASHLFALAAAWSAPAAIDFRSILVPGAFWDPPTVVLGAVGGDHGQAVRADTVAPLVKYFLQWDAWCWSAALLTWAVYVRVVTGDRLAGDGRLLRVLGKAAGWTVVGGFNAAAAVLLWERDEIARHAIEGGKGKRE